MNTAHGIFKKIINDTKNAGVLYSYLNGVIHPPYDYTDLLRWQWAQSGSSLDKLIHDLVRIGMVEIFIGRRSQTPKYLTFTIGMDTYDLIANDIINAVSIFEKQIIIRHGFLSFQEPDKISDALSNIWEEQHKWKKISEKLGLDESYAKIQLKNIAIRRNQIVHEGDYSSRLLDRQPLTESDVQEVITFIENLGLAIYELVKL